MIFPTLTSCAGHTASNRRAAARISARASSGLRGQRIPFGFAELRGTGGAAIRLEGKRGGSAAGEANASPSEDPAAIAAACAGPGLRSVSIDITLATTPAISG